MRWKAVALAGVLGPAAVGCNIYRLAAHNLANEVCVVGTQHEIEHDLRKEAGRQWREVRKQYPRRAFTAEFRDGFEDGFVDYLDRGGNGSLPAVPPGKYTRHEKYFTENGQCLVKDYFLGFKYGQEIAIATGKRQFLTVPVLLPVVPSGPPAFAVQPPVDPPPLMHPPTALPTSNATATRALPKPAASPPVPLPVAPPAAPAVKLPAPPPEVPTLPDHVPTPPVHDELPVVAPFHGDVPPVAPHHGDVPPVPPDHGKEAGK